VLRKLLVVVVVALAVAPAAAAGLTRPEASLLRAMNQVRRAHRLPALRYDVRLERAARFHSHEMLADDVFQHGAFGERMARFQVTGRLAGENLAWGTGSRGTARGVVAAWLASPEHRANLLRRTFTRVGIGELSGGFLGYAGARVVTADFAG
jgi:uncharacterized protein YkwD